MKTKTKGILLTISMISIVLLFAFFGELIAKITAAMVAVLLGLGFIVLVFSGDSDSSSSGFIMGYIFGSKK